MGFKPSPWLMILKFKFSGENSLFTFRRTDLTHTINKLQSLLQAQSYKETLLEAVTPSVLWRLTGARVSITTHFIFMSEMCLKLLIFRGRSVKVKWKDWKTSTSVTSKPGCCSCRGGAVIRASGRRANSLPSSLCEPATCCSPDRF